MITKLKSRFLRFLLSHTSVYLKDQELALSEKEKLDLFKQRSFDPSNKSYQLIT